MRKLPPGFAAGRSGNPDGRPKGARGRLTVRVFSDVLQHWGEPSENDPTLTRGLEALQRMFCEKPNEYVRAVLSVMPKEIAVESINADVASREIEDVMTQIKEHIIAIRTAADEKEEAPSVH